MLSKWEMVGLGALLLLGGSGAASAAEIAASEKKLLERANQARAKRWADVLDDLGGLHLPMDVAAAAARWFGIESGGNPLAVSSQGERGLAQITKTSALTEGALTLAEWNALIDPKTTEDEQARIAWKVIQWCYGRATKYIHTPPTNEIDQIWYAKLYHQRPVDVRDAQLTGEARADSARLEMEWAGDPAKLHRLHAANVVAWNSLSPPFPGLAQR